MMCRMFWDAINDIEDRMAVISMDVDLLDRAERRDLPTAHQELIARARAEGADSTTTDCNTDMDFSDMDNFMNWNTSSSFENFDEWPRHGSRQPRRKATSISRKPSDKVEDDVVHRICRDHNRIVPDGVNPISKVGTQFFLHAF